MSSVIGRKNRTIRVREPAGCAVCGTTPRRSPLSRRRAGACRLTPASSSTYSLDFELGQRPGRLEKPSFVSHDLADRQGSDPGRNLVGTDDMNSTDRKPAHWSFIQATVLGLVTAMIGYGVGTSGNENLGLVVFCLAPLGTGFVVAQFVQKRALVVAAGLSIGCAAAGLLVATGAEGLLCCILASPLLAGGFALGAWWGLAVPTRNGSRGDDRFWLILFALLFPALLAAGRAAENARYTFPSEQLVTTTITVPCSPADAWRYIKEIERMEGSLPLLLKLGLPVPTRCTLSINGVGGERICYFRKGGIIRQRVTVWEPHTRMAFDITGCTLHGREWLQFIDAEYEFHPAEGGTTVVRHTRIHSALSPRFYWRPLEALGVRTEHDYVLQNLLRFASTQSPPREAATGDLDAP